MQTLARVLLSRSSSHGPGALSSSPLVHLVDETPNFICISKRPLGTCPRGQKPVESMPIDVKMTCLPR